MRLHHPFSDGEMWIHDTQDDLMGYIEGQGFYERLNPKTWHRDRWIIVPFALFLGIPAALAAAPFILIGLSISYFVDRRLSPESVSQKNFVVKAWLWFKSLVQFFITFWRTGFIDELLERERLRSNKDRYWA